MKKQRKHCNNCHYSYYRTEGQRGKRQHCNNPNYNSAAYVKLRFSPDCCDTLGFANSMVDLLRYLDRENRRLEKLCLEQQNESDKEAA